jgi:hypothetical protein
MSKGGKVAGEAIGAAGETCHLTPAHPWKASAPPTAWIALVAWSAQTVGENCAWSGAETGDQIAVTAAWRGVTVVVTCEAWRESEGWSVAWSAGWMGVWTGRRGGWSGVGVGVWRKGLCLVAWAADPAPPRQGYQSCGAWTDQERQGSSMVDGQAWGRWRGHRCRVTCG